MLSPNTPLEELVASAKKQLTAQFGSYSEFVAVAPGRVNLIGEHIDYCDGFVMPFAIERAVVIAAAPNGTSEARIATAHDTAMAVFPLNEKQEKGAPKWSNYLRGVVAGFQEIGVEVPGFDAFIVSSLPGGAGLSSSAALECAVATLIEGLTKNPLETRQKALLAQKAEHDFAGVPCGIMDQFASAFGQEGQLVMIDCRSTEIDLVPFDDPELTLLVSNTKVSHELSDGAYAARRISTEVGLEFLGKDSWREVTEEDLASAEGEMSSENFTRSRHVIREIARTEEAAAALKAKDFEKLGELMYASHASLRDDFEVSCPELDFLVEAASQIGSAGGVIGSRMTGGGFGGSTITLCRTADAEAIAAKFTADYEAKFGFSPEIFATRPAAGARLV